MKKPIRLGLIGCGGIVQKRMHVHIIRLQIPSKYLLLLMW